MQLVIEVDVGAARRVEAGQELAHHDQELEVGRFLNEPALGFVLVGFGALAGLEDVLRVGVELVAFVAVRRLQRDGCGVRLEGGDDAAVLAKRLAEEDAEVVAGVVDTRGHEDRSAPVVVQARLGVEIVDDAGGDAGFALLGAHQFLHRGPALANDRLLEIVQRLRFLREICLDGFG